MLGVLDKAFLTYREAKIVKDVSKVGGGFELRKTLIVDDKSNHKFYYDCGSSLHLIDSNRNHVRIGRIRGKLVKL